MKIFTSLIYFDTDDGGIYKVDTIEHENKFWLVPEWLESEDRTHRFPLRIISLENLSHTQMFGSPFGDFRLSQPIAKAVFDGQSTVAGYIVLDRPDIRVQHQIQH